MISGKACGLVRKVVTHTGDLTKQNGVTGTYELGRKQKVMVLVLDEGYQGDSRDFDLDAALLKHGYQKIPSKEK